MAGKGQGVLDIALQYAGSAEAAWEIAVRNGCGITSPVEGTMMGLPSVPMDADTVAAMAADGVRPACDTAAPESTKAIGAFVIGTDKIS